MQEAALVFTSNSKLHEDNELKKKQCLCFQGHHRPFPQFPTPETTNLESNYSKNLLQTGNTTSNQISFKVP